MLVVRAVALITVAVVRLEQFYKVLLAALVEVISVAAAVAVLLQLAQTVL